MLILGNIGVRGGGMNALRGHSNIQGLTDFGLMSDLLPGYLNIPTDRKTTSTTYMSTRGFKPLRPNQTSYWQNYRKFFVSFQKSMWGAAATADNDWAYDWLPKLDVPGYDILRAFDMMFQGKMNGYFCQGFNPLLAFPNQKEAHGRAIEAEVPRHHGPARHRDRSVLGEPWRVQRRRYRRRSRPKSSSFRPLVSPRKTGSLTNSGRWLQWHWAGGTPPGEAKHDTWIMAQLGQRLKALYAEGRRRVPRSDRQSDLAL